MKNTLILLEPKFLSIKNTVSSRFLIRRLPFTAIGLLFWVLFYMGTNKVLEFIRSIEIFGEIVSMKILAMIFFSLTGFLLLSNIITAISAFYLSKDIQLLLSKPVEIREILRLKTVEAITESTWMVVSFVPPVFIAYGVNYNATWKFYILLLLIFIPFVFIPAGIGISIAHLLTRVFPVKKTKNVLLALGLVLFVVIYFLLKSIVPLNIDSPEGFINALISFKTDSPLLPGYWMTRTISPFLKGSSPDFLYPFLLISSSAFFLLVSGIIGLRLYRDNLDRIHDSAKKPNKWLIMNYPGAKKAMLWKDTKIFFRDTEQWSQIFIIGALVMIYVYNFMAIPITALSGITFFLKDIMVMVNMAFAGLVLTAVSARFLYASVSLEGRAFWVIKASPVMIRRFLWSKFLQGFVPVTVIMLTLVFITNILIGIDGPLMCLSLATVLIICLSISGLGTGFGAIYPKFKYENIASVSMSLTSVTFMLIAFCVVMITVFLEAWPFYLFRKAELMQQETGFFEYSQVSLSVFIIVMLNFLVFYLPMMIGAKRLEGDME